MRPSLDARYLHWLYARIGNADEQDQRRSYWSLMQLLHSREFVWLIPNDDNRVEDGRDLRYSFRDEVNAAANFNPDRLGPGCSVLEMLVALSDRLAFEADRTPRLWFWELMNNLGLSGFTDDIFYQHADRADDIINALIWRSYSSDGFGGMFPLRHPRQDQRKAEIWDQLNQYILEGH